MDTPMIAALIYAGCAAIVMIFHAAMAAGAPWGHLTMGGRWPGRYSGALRVLSLAQIAVLATMAWVVLKAGGVLPGMVASWALWLVVAFTGLTLLANGATPSPAERRLWFPVTIIMFAAVLFVAI